MAFSLNKIFLIGTLGQDSETRTTTNGTSVTKFSLATTDSKKVGDNWEDETTWHNVVCFKQSDYMLDRLKKGSRFHIEGKQVNRKYEKDGTTKYFSEVIANKLIPLDKVKNNTEGKTNNFDLPSQEKDVAPEDDLPF